MLPQLPEKQPLLADGATVFKDFKMKMRYEENFAEKALPCQHRKTLLIDKVVGNTLIVFMTHPEA